MRRISFSDAIQNKKLICYGAGLSLAGIMKAVALPIAYVVDDTPGLQGTRIGGSEIRPSSVLDDENPGQVFILICAHTPRATNTIARILSSKGFRYGHSYADCSFLHFETVGKKLAENLNIKPNYEKFARSRVLSLNLPEENLSTLAGSWLFTEIVDSFCRNGMGDVAEFGVYKGGNAFVALMSSNMLASRPYHLLDSFQGFPELSNVDPASRSNDFRDTNVEAVKKMFQDFENVHIHQGFFESTLPALADREFCVSYIDCDLYEPTKFCLEFLYPRTVKGGCILFHDYWLPDSESQAGGKACWKGISQAVKEFDAISTESLIVFPETTHALYVKP